MTTVPQLEINIADSVATSEMLREAAARGYDMRPAMRRIRDVLIAGNAKQFRSKGSYLGERWPANVPGTIARKNRSGIPSLNSTLVESGDLELSLSGGAGRRTRVSRGSVRVGTALWYAHFALGTKNEPSRVPTGIGDVEASTSVDLMEAHLMGRLW